MQVVYCSPWHCMPPRLSATTIARWLCVDIAVEASNSDSNSPAWTTHYVCFCLRNVLLDCSSLVCFNRLVYPGPASCLLCFYASWQCWFGASRIGAPIWEASPRVPCRRGSVALTMQPPLSWLFHSSLAVAEASRAFSFQWVLPSHSTPHLTQLSFCATVCVVSAKLYWWVSCDSHFRYAKISPGTSSPFANWYSPYPTHATSHGLQTW